MEGRILQALRPRRDGVLLRADISGFGSASQVSSALASLQAKGQIRKLSHGVYAKPAMVARLGEQAVLSAAQQRRSLLRQRKRRERALAQLTPTALHVHRLAKRTGVWFVPTYADRWAAAVTRMAGDDVTSDPTDDLLVALRRAGKVTPAEMASLVIAHHRERRLV